MRCPHQLRACAIAFSLWITQASAQTAASASGGVPVWVDQSGRKIQAEFVRLTADHVIVKLNGRETPLKLDQLADESYNQALQLSSKGAAPPPAITKAPQGSSFKGGTPVSPGLQQITPPQTSDPQALADYIRRLLDFSAYVNNKLDTAIQKERVSLLSAVAKDHFDLFLEQVANGSGKKNVSSKMAMVEVVTENANEKNRAAILKAFERNHAITAVITQKNWTAAAMPHAAASLRNFDIFNGMSSFESDFFAFVFESEDKAIWDAITAVFSNPAFWMASANFNSAVRKMSPKAAEKNYERFVGLAGLIFETAVKQDTSASKSYHILSSAVNAVQYGHLPALQVLAEFLTTGEPAIKVSGDYWQRSAVEAITKVTDCKDSLPPADVGKWTLDRIAQLKWKKDKKRFK